MDAEKLRAKAEFILYHIPDRHLEEFVIGMEKLAYSVRKEESEAFLQRILKEDRGLLKRLAEWPEKPDEPIG
jgi:hypothetical protein